MSSSTASIAVPNHKRNLFGSYVVLITFSSLMEVVPNVANLCDAQTRINCRVSSEDTGPFAIVICDSFQNRYDCKLARNWFVLWSSSVSLNVCDIPNKSSLLRPFSSTFDNATLERTPLYVLTPRLKVFVTACDRSLHPYSNAYVGAAITLFTSLQHNYKVCATRATRSFVGENAWLTISPVDDCYVSVMFSSQTSVWKRLVISPGDSVLLHSSVTFRLLFLDVSFTALTAICANLSYNEEVTLSLQRFASMSDETVRPMDNTVLFSSSIYVPYFRRQAGSPTAKTHFIPYWWIRNPTIEMIPR